MSRKSKSDRVSILKRLTVQNPTPDFFEQNKAQTFAKDNDRGAAILAVANLENALETAISSAMEVERAQKIFASSDNGISAFDSKIKLGYMLNLYGDTTYKALKCIKEIRNAFAHAKTPITFKTPEIIGVCELLPPLDGRQYDRAHYDIPDDFPEEREHFQIYCAELAFNLVMINFGGPISIHRNALKENISFQSRFNIIKAFGEPLP